MTDFDQFLDCLGCCLNTALLESVMVYIESSQKEREKKRKKENMRKTNNTMLLPTASVAKPCPVIFQAIYL